MMLRAMHSACRAAAAYGTAIVTRRVDYAATSCAEMSACDDALYVIMLMRRAR